MRFKKDSGNNGYHGLERKGFAKSFVFVLLGYEASRKAIQNMREKIMFVVLSFLFGVCFGFFLESAQEKGNCAINFHLCYKALLVL